MSISTKMDSCVWQRSLLVAESMNDYIIPPRFDSNNDVSPINRPAHEKLLIIIWKCLIYMLHHYFTSHSRSHIWTRIEDCSCTRIWYVLYGQQYEYTRHGNKRTWGWVITAFFAARPRYILRDCTAFLNIVRRKWRSLVAKNGATTHPCPCL